MKLIIFDLDGVLVEAKEIHFNALNSALPEKYKISYQEHLLTYDGLKTNQKLDMLSKNKGLPLGMHAEVWKNKQLKTQEELENISINQSHIELLTKLSSMGMKLAVCSNSIHETVVTVLEKQGIIKFFDTILSNECVTNSKPHPEIYWKAMADNKVTPDETLIIEDSPVGLLAASRSNCNILRVKSPSELTFEKINEKLNIKDIIVHKWEDKKMNVLIPMAGAGSRFTQAGYTFPKPLIEVRGKPMIQVVVENLNLDANFIFVVQKEHREKYQLDSLLNLIAPNCKIVEVSELTEGAACTALLAKQYIDSDDPLFFANSDQFVEWDSTEFMYKMSESAADGGIVTFKATHPKWSFAKVDENGYVTEVAEKNPISDNATVGFYYWSKGKDFVKYAEEMIEKDIRVNNEFYVCPVFNQAIKDKLNIRTYEIQGMWGLGTPEDLDYYIKNYQID
ncbi:MAG: hypothetical protein CMQ70_00710 [Gammaproteobacteria bacterium]|nr:hypothetical protein [Gammaproteobacteria bacterium]|tara:strand:- start:2432 stop:3784 length:1353 start_codon:yes stop_codon:yes gene_type:complete